MHSRKWLGFVVAIFLVSSASAAFAEDVVVRVRPPHGVTERRVPMPGPGYVWIPGYQRWTGNGFAWETGRWENPPRPHAKWVPHRWEKRGRTWVLREGHWR
jgi:hypothetical protein